MTETLDLAIVGAGPCGVAVGAAAERAGLTAVLFDRGCITRSLIDYPYYMTFFSTAAKLEIGGVPFTIPDAKPTRREALAYYRRVVRHYGMDVRQYHDVTAVSGRAGDFALRTRLPDGSETGWRARAVVVATGGFHDPNRLGVPGEELDKVLHYYREPYPFTSQRVLIVGAGNSAVEAALDLHRNDVHVTLVHFAEAIDRGVKPWVVPDINNRLERGEIPAYWRHRVAEIRWHEVVLRHEDSGVTTTLDNDWVLAMTGWRAQPALLGELGVGIDEATGIPAHDASTMETDVEGIYIAGVLAAGHDANKIFIENGKEHGGRIVAHYAGRTTASAKASTVAGGPSGDPTATSVPGSTSRRT
jgi:thioredoxin reductase (NADPH)